MTTNTKRNTTKPSNTTKPVIVEAATQTEKDIFKLLVDTGKLETKQVALSDKLLHIAKGADTVDTFLDACRNAEKSYKAISKANTIPRAWTQSKSDIKAMFSELASFDTISQLKKVKNIQAAEARKAAKKDKATESVDKVNTTKVLTDKGEILAKLLADMPSELADSMLDIFIQQANTALQSEKEKPAAKPKAKPKAKSKAA